MNRLVTVHGAGLAGCSAAIAALQEGSAVRLIDQARFPRHKVCGEFLSPEAFQILSEAGLEGEFAAAQPARVPRLEVHLGRRRLVDHLPEPAYGLSRFAMDALMQRKAVSLGADFQRGVVAAASPPLVEALGRKVRQVSVEKGSRLFGFKAHFSGPASDAVELYFFQGCYVGITPIEGGLTNVCGLGPQACLQNACFEIDELVNSHEPLRERLQPLTRCWDWLKVGPLLFQNRLHANPVEGVYPAGDLLSFVDPFTGSGMLSALLTGRLAGLAAARGDTVQHYLRRCEESILQPFRFSSAFRWLLRNGWAEHLAPLVPGRYLFRWTRPRVLKKNR